MGPVQDSTCPGNDRRCGAKARRRPRPRCCLLKGCERRFRPRLAAQRYCSVECGQAARRWSRWKAQQSYRATAAGKEKRNRQSRRYRERVKSRQQAAPEEAVAEPARVITPNFFDCCCDRPGCYEGFVRQRRSPGQRYCSRACRRALERVRQRERRWQREPRLQRRM